jgi:DNA-binding FadR family transcriptional regulator
MSMIAPSAEPQALAWPRKTRAEELRLMLADEIVRGVLTPGAALDENTLARRFEVSRTPVREAIRLLAARIALPWWRGRASISSPACSKPWRNWKRCAPALPPSG